MSERVLITGGAGFVGSHLCERLLDRGAEVVCVDNFITGRLENVAHLKSRAGFELVHHDMIVPFKPSKAPDWVLHLASPASPYAYLAHPIETLQVGSAGTTNALEIARDSDAVFLLASTSEVYGDPTVSPQPESYRGNVSTTGPRSVYDESKRFAEAMTMAYHRKYGTKTRIARIFNTYGPRLAPRDGRAVPTFIMEALSEKPITVYGDGSQTRSFCYVDDLVEGLLALAASDEPDPVNLGNPDERTIMDLAERVLKKTGSPSGVRYEPLPEDDPKIRCPDITRARTILGWEPKVDLDEGLDRTIEWFRSGPDPGSAELLRPGT